MFSIRSVEYTFSDSIRCVSILFVSIRCLSIRFVKYTFREYTFCEYTLCKCIINRSTVSSKIRYEIKEFFCVLNFVILLLYVY
jgi:hypothetical protein